MTPAIPKRRWFQFGMRGLFVVVTLSCCLLASERNRALRRQEFAGEIEAAGGQVTGQYQFGDARYFCGRGKALNWLAEVMGDRGLMTTVVVPDAKNQSLVDRSATIFPESTIWAYDKFGALRLLPDSRCN
jgi:hypothetical protein